MKNKMTFVLLHILVGIMLVSCQKFLESKPDKTQVIPATLKDCIALLDDYRTMNASYPSDGEASSDNYYLLGTSWQALRDKQDQDTYTWDATGKRFLNQWLNPYKVVYTTNLVLQVIDKVPLNQSEQEEKNAIKGAALFFRAYAHYQVAILFAANYDAKTADQLPGIPLRLTPDLNFISERGTVAKTYHQIINDLLAAVELLPLNTSLPTRPCKAAAYAALARTYLAMEDYSNAGKMANECLKLKSTLMDYNSVNVNGSAPFVQFNSEVIFHSVTLGGALFATGVSKVDPDLYFSYSDHDLRKKAFFRVVQVNAFSFKGNYDGKYSPMLFNGLATDEVYLIRAECSARAGNAAAAMADLNLLMKNRWNNQVNFVPFTASNAMDALAIVLKERRKELVFRNIRFTDLKRLNNDPEFETTLTRTLTINGQNKVYTLLPNDLRYNLLIPEEVLQATSMTQNPR